jgi:pimeloyl-ACP methyl ester carboxylesterase
MRLNYERRGSGEPLVLIHGIGHRWQAWLPVLDLLAEQRDVIAIDLPGFGGSPSLPAGQRSLDGMITLLRKFFAELGVHRPHAAGNSLGGLLSLELANRDAVRSVTALSPAGFFRLGGRVQALSIIACYRAAGRLPAGTLAAIGRSPRVRSLACGMLFARPDRLDWTAATADLAAMHAAPGFYPTAWAGRRYRYGGRPGVPVIIAWGAKDRILPLRQARVARKLLPHARHVLLPGCGHVPMSDEPELVARLLLHGSRTA